MPEKVFAKRTVATYTYLRAVSWFAFDLAKKNEIGRYNHLITTMLFSAFCLEAFLNHVGKDKITFWENLKSLTPQNKLKVISSVIGFEPDFSKRPFQTFTAIFSLRNNLVHAETIEIENGFLLNEGNDIAPLENLSKWEEQITIGNAKRFLDDTKEMVLEIADFAGYDPKTVLNMEKPRRIIRSLGSSSMVSS
jgi:hypothetical protein